jgi:hypothetical protein
MGPPLGFKAAVFLLGSSLSLCACGGKLSPATPRDRALEAQIPSSESSGPLVVPPDLPTFLAPPDQQPLALLSPPQTDLDQIPRGLINVSGLEHDEQASPYQVQLYARQTQLQAQAEAERWASDAKQFYVGIGFWKTPWLGAIKHAYYSPSKDQLFILFFKLFKGIMYKEVTKDPQFALGNRVLAGAQDAWAVGLDRAYDKVRNAGYKPKGGAFSIGVLVHPIVIGPVWVFIDNPENQNPLLAIHARDGRTIGPGDIEMGFIKQIFEKPAAVKNP